MLRVINSRQIMSASAAAVFESGRQAIVSLKKKGVPRHSGSVSPAARVELSGAGFFCPPCRIQELCTKIKSLVNKGFFVQK
jgi:hypothetical protein